LDTKKYQHHRHFIYCQKEDQMSNHVAHIINRFPLMLIWWRRDDNCNGQ